MLASYAQLGDKIALLKGKLASLYFENDGLLDKIDILEQGVHKLKGDLNASSLKNMNSQGKYNGVGWSGAKVE